MTYARLYLAQRFVCDGYASYSGTHSRKAGTFTPGAIVNENGALVTFVHAADESRAVVDVDVGTSCTGVETTCATGGGSGVDCVCAAARRQRKGVPGADST